MTHEKTSSYCKPCQVGTDLFEAQFEKIFSDFRYFPVPVKSSGAIMVCIDLSGLQSCLNMWQFGDGSLGIKRRFLLYLIISIYIPQTPVCHMSKLRPGCVAMGGWCAWPGQHVRWRRWRISSITRRPAIERNRRTQVPGKYMYSHSVSIEIAAEHWYPWVTSFGLFRTVRILWAFFEGYGGGGFVPPEASHCFPGSLTAQSVGIMKPIHH